jgi:hypothetical protein
MVSAAIGVTVLLHPPGSAAGQAEMLVGMETADRNLISINPLPPTWEIIAFTGFDTSMTGLRPGEGHALRLRHPLKSSVHN